MSKHFLYISSWYPQAYKSNGTFIEMQLLAMQEVGFKVGILQTEELTMGNFLRKRMRGERLFHYRPHDGIPMVDNLVIHRLPLRFVAHPERVRREAIIAGAIRRVEAYIKKERRPEAFFHHGIFDFCYLTSALSAHFGIPYWYMEHSAFVEEGNVRSRNAHESEADLRRFVDKAQHCFAVSEGYAQRFSKLFGRRFSCVPNVLPAYFFAENAQQEVLSEATANTVFQFVNVGILEAHKQQELLLEAFAKAFRGQHEVQLTIAGDGRLGSHLLHCAQALGISSQVQLPGFVSRDQLFTLLDGSQVFVLSSSHETFGVVLIEAMARGLPVIAPDIEGPHEIVFGGVGTLFRAGDVDHLAEQLRWIKQVHGEYDAQHIINTCRLRYGAGAFKQALLKGVGESA